jgi:hypothetical protein
MIENIEEIFCEKCIFILKNIKTIYDTNELTDYMRNEDFKFSKQVCKFCFGILCFDFEEEMQKQISQNIGNYEFIDFKLTTNFSPLFLVLHNYWKIKLKSKLKDPKEVTMIDVPLFRKTFKPLIVPKMEKYLNKPHENKSDFEIRCVFEFDENYYNEVLNY